MLKWLTLVTALIAGQAHAETSSRKPFFNFNPPAERFAFVDLIPAGQSGLRYVCQFPYDRKIGWVPERLALSFNGRAGNLVTDGVIARHHSGPRRMTVRQRHNGNLVARWTVFDVRDKQRKHSPYLGYELQIDRGTGAARMVVRPKLFSTRFRASGRCTPVS